MIRLPSIRIKYNFLDRFHEIEKICAYLAFSILAFHSSAISAEKEDPVSLNITVIDDSSDAITPCTLEIVNSKGQSIKRDPSYRNGFRSNGSVQLQLPQGPTRIRITRGFETQAVDDLIELRPGQEEDRTYRLKRIVNLREKGWYSGDSHAHMIHGERDIPVDFESVALAAKAEDLQYLSLAHDWIIPEATPEELEAELNRVSIPTCMLTWNIEAPKNYWKGDAGRCLGHGWTLDMKGRTENGQNVIPLLLQLSAH
jgi:hypothetical protein